MEAQEHIRVFYDGACPRCVKDRDNFQRLAGKQASCVEWFDITEQDQALVTLGIDPDKALHELHISVQAKNSEPKILSELDAYIVLMSKARLLKPLALLIALPLIRPLLSRIYHSMVERRLARSGRA
ncbi:DCC1-like thiol-disulfide oxidoreductase family protein [Litoribacillus peritrichatus]